MSSKHAALPAELLVLGAILALGSGHLGPAVAWAQTGATSGTEVVGESESAAARLSVGQILAAVKAAGYTEVRKIEREHGLYEVKARDPKGLRVEIFVDPKTRGLVLDPDTGKPREHPVTETDSPAPPLDFEAVVATLKAEGFPEVYSIEYEHALFEIKARDTAGRNVELYVHPETGDLLRHPKTGKPLKEVLDE